MGCLESVSLYGILGIHPQPDMGGIRIRVTVNTNVLIHLFFAENGISHEYQAVRIIDQITPVFVKELGHLIILESCQVRHIRIGTHSLIGHHAHHIFYIAFGALVSLIADLIALVVDGKAVDCRHYIFLEKHIINPVICVIFQLLFPLYCGIAAVEHGNVYSQAAVILPGHVYAVQILGHDIGKNHILQLFLCALFQLPRKHRNLFGTLAVAALPRIFLGLQCLRIFLTVRFLCFAYMIKVVKT